MLKLLASQHLLADVLSIEHFTADVALEAAQVPVFVQGHQRLFVLKLLATAAAIYTQNIHTNNNFKKKKINEKQQSGRQWTS